ncbi:NADPH-Fe(3+) oxidoreductase subunit beta [Oxobacter pfennigii]|uniref:NADPH-Fe(3+) oxidoreductase subunit beta n=1 Tax=Oxobacter pfennigii TaxID=36849 RepID=A0A0P8WDZ9_9CLOT|nr:NAD(P)-binding protein [Oxobacter pfennigii]KPU46330.1 NADPH-Fe(3+) oxidoreductase subunit beta [Oxobacter pfennigii]
MSVIRININDREITTSDDRYLLDIALENGIEIPHLCHDERIKPYGACGMCVVEIEGSPKLQRACATLAADGMVIKTHTKRTDSTRKSALRLLLSDHRGDCRPPCVQACPANTDCQGYVGLIANGQYRESVELIKEQLPFPASIGRVCPHPCEKACRRHLVEEPVSIAALKAFVGDIDLQGEGFIPEVGKETGKKVAVVGAGPAGLTAASFLRRFGHEVVIYEAMPAPGGMLRYGIPQYRLPKDILDAEINLIERMGVEIKYNTKVGTDVTIDFLKKHYDAVFLGIGAWESSSLRCKGEDMEGVLGGIDFLREVTMNNKVTIGKKVLVVGGGNTAMDVARTAVRLGAEEVSVLYRRTREEMPAEDIEIEEAEEEGVIFNFLVAPVEVVGDGTKATGIRCEKMRLGEADASGRRKPEPTGEEIVFEADTIIAAIGQQVNARNIEGLNVGRSGNITIDESTFETNIPGVFAGGDAATGPKIAIAAIAQGKDAAVVIDSYLNGKIVPVHKPNYVKQDDITSEDFADREKCARVKIKTVDSGLRRTNFTQVAYTMTEEEARKEASRCLECGCRDFFECQLINYVHEYDVNTDEKMGEKHKRKEIDEHPFIERNSDKCILCGLCVRACDEVMGVTALGLVSRGFDTIVKPEFKMPLSESECISCGQCVSVCPVGACMEKQAVYKQIPVKLEDTNTVCSFCGVGCNLTLQTNGNFVYRSVPNKGIEEGLLCAAGRFGITHINDVDRLKKPVIRIKGHSSEADWDEAVLNLVKKLQAVRAKYGDDSIAFAVSPRLTNEEVMVVKKAAEKLGTSIIGSFSLNSQSGLKDIFGYDASTNSYEELKNADLILSVGKVAENHPVLGIKVKNAAAGKAKLITVSEGRTRMEEWADVSLNTSNGADLLKGIMKALIETGAVNEAEVLKTAVGYDELKAFVADAVVSEEAKNIAKLYGDSKKPVIVVDEDTVTGTGIDLLADIAAITGKVGKPHRGIIVVRSKSNSQGLADLGVDKSGEELMELIAEKKVKALVLLGEDLAGDDNTLNQLKDIEFLAVGDMFMTVTAAMADAVLPLVSFAETNGTITRSDRKVQELKAAVKSHTGKTNLELFLEIAGLLGVNLKTARDVKAAIALEVPGYEKLTEDTDFYTADKQSLYSEGFMTTDEKIHLSVPCACCATEIFKDRVVYDTIDKQFLNYMKEKGIAR